MYFQDSILSRQQTLNEATEKLAEKSSNLRDLREIKEIFNFIRWQIRIGRSGDQIPFEELSSTYGKFITDLQFLTNNKVEINVQLLLNVARSLKEQLEINPELTEQQKLDLKSFGKASK